MKNFFEFIDAPDFATPLSETYKPVNVSYDRREELEKQNDQTREENAEMPLKLIKAIADFSPKAKELSDKLALRSLNKNLEAGFPELNDETMQLYEQDWAELDDWEKVNLAVEEEAVKTGDLDTLEVLKRDGVNLKRYSHNFLTDVKNSIPSWWAQYVAANHPAGFENMKEYREAYNSFRNHIEQTLLKQGFNSRMIKFITKDQFSHTQDLAMQDASKNIVERSETDIKFDRLTTISNILNTGTPDTIFTDAEAWVEKHKHLYNNNLADTWTQFFNLAWTATENSDRDLTELFEDILMNESSDGYNSLLEKLGGGDAGKLRIHKIAADFENARNGTFELINTKQRNYEAGIQERIREAIEANGGPLSEAQLDKFIEDWDWSISPNLPNWMAEYYSEEDLGDVLGSRLLDQHIRDGEKVTKGDIDRLIYDLELRAKYYRQFGFTNADGADTVGNYDSLGTLSKHQYDVLNKTITQYTTALDKVAGAHLSANALDYFDQRFQYAMKDAASVTQAWEEAMADLELWQKGQVFYEGSTAFKPEDEGWKSIDEAFHFGEQTNDQLSFERRLRLLDAEVSIKNNEKDLNTIINSEIIFGSEEIIKEIYESGTGKVETHLFYTQLAGKLTNAGYTIDAHTLQHAQLTVYADLINAEKPAISPMLAELLELKDTNPEAYNLLNNFGDGGSEAGIDNYSAKLHAYIAAYSPESEHGSKIHFSEFTNLLPDIQTFLQAESDKTGSETEGQIVFIDKDTGIVSYADQIRQVNPEHGDYFTLNTSAEQIGSFLGIDLYSPFGAGEMHLQWIVEGEGEDEVGRWVMRQMYSQPGGSSSGIYSTHIGNGEQWGGVIDGFTVQRFDPNANDGNGGWVDVGEVTNESFEWGVKNGRNTVENWDSSILNTFQEFR